MKSSSYFLLNYSELLVDYLCLNNRQFLCIVQQQQKLGGCVGDQIGQPVVPYRAMGYREISGAECSRKQQLRKHPVPLPSRPTGTTPALLQKSLESKSMVALQEHQERIENGCHEGTSRARSGVKMSSSGKPRSSANCATADGNSFLPLFLAAGGCVTTAAT